MRPSIEMVYLSMAGTYARMATGCTKVSVGSCIVTDSGLCFGANKVVGDLCQSKGCLRIEKYGDNAKTHRNPDDCRAIHSEIDAIGNASKSGFQTEGATIYVTRYPCEACARAIIAAGIKKVVFGRNQPISDMTKQMFEEAGVEWVDYPEYQEDDTVV